MSSSLDIYAKITVGEAAQWIKDFSQAHTDLGGLTVALILASRPTEFKNPRRPRSSKVSSDSSEREALDYNPELCDARLKLKGGIPVQCSKSKADGCSCCKKHQSIADKNDGISPRR